jgi:hypothetical protein
VQLRSQLYGFLACAVLFLCAGCRSKPLDEKITARNDLDFAMWLARQPNEITVEDRKDLRDALQQIKFTVMTASPGLTPAEQSAAVYAEVRGHTIREVLSASFILQHDRIAAEVAALLKREDRYREVDPATLNVESREFLEGFNVRMETRRAEMQRLEDRRTSIETR